IDASGVAPRIEGMLPAGVRRRQLSVRTLLAGMYLTQGDHRPAWGSVTPSGATGTVRPGSPTIGPGSQAVSPIGQTIGPSIPADGPLGAWWNKTSSNGTEGGGLLAQDNRANDLSYIAQDKASGDDAALSSDGA